MDIKTTKDGVLEEYARVVDELDEIRRMICSAPDPLEEDQLAKVTKRYNKLRIDRDIIKETLEVCKL